MEAASSQEKKFTLRKNQQDAITKLRDAIKNGDKKIVLQAATGYGKTVLAAEIAANCLKKGNKAIFCVPMLILIDQTIEKFTNHGIPVDKIGVIQADHPMTDKSRPLQIASVQTLTRRGMPSGVDIFVIDECHIDYKIIGKMMESPQFSNTIFVGLSATPWTRGLGKKYSKLIVAANINDLINEGSLSKFKVFAPYRPDLSNARTVAGDFHEGDSSKIMNEQKITADIVSTWLKIGENRPTILFAVDRRHAQQLQYEFNEVGISSGYIDANTTREERLEIRDKFHKGEIKVVCSVDCLTVGMDWDVRCLIIARPTKSEAWHTQAIGRGLRTAPGKDHCLILDHAGNHYRLGFVTDIHYDELCDGVKWKKKRPEKKEKKTAECPGCHAVLKGFKPQCPECGFVFKVISTVLTEDGELVVFDANGVQQSIVSEIVSRETMQIWYSGILSFSRERGYSSGWAAHTFKEKFNKWPNEARVTDIVLDTIPSDVHRHCVMKLMRFKKQAIRQSKSASTLKTV